ncbi:MAG: permease-like cell division protein FtsX [Rikenellaceae bacterium]
MSKVKHKYFISTFSISLVLFLLLVVCTLGYVVESATTTIVNQIQISVLIKEGIKQSEIDGLIAELKEDKYIETIEFTSKDKAAEIYKKATGEDFTLFIDENPLPASIDICFSGDNITNEKIAQLSKSLATNVIVDEVLHSQRVVDQVLGHVYKIKFMLYSFLITLLVISILLINNAIKLTIHSKRFLIKSMKLIGATDAFICRPFLWDAIKQGFIASLVASLFFVVTLVGINRGVTSIAAMTEDELLAGGMIFVAVMITGIMISVICTAIAINKQLHKKNNELYTY